MAITDSDSPLVTVITGATGNPLLRHCMESVQRQTYGRVEHMVVIDGPGFAEPARAIIAAIAGDHPIHVTQLPLNTGNDGFNGHRIYGAMPFLCQGNYVAFLDEEPAAGAGQAKRGSLLAAALVAVQLAASVPCS